MEFIFHEKQEGSLCAQHCLNNLFQGEYFSPVELASTAHQLDEEERMRMAEGGVSSEDYRAFLQQPSGNMDDTGFFSIQWFNLDSLLAGPELISDTYLALFLSKLQKGGNSVFVVKGDLPDCEADQLLQTIRVKQIDRPKLTERKLPQEKQQRDHKTALEKVSEETDESDLSDEDEEHFQRALALSHQATKREDEDLHRAIELSMPGTSRNTSQDLPQTSCVTPALEELKKIKDYCEKHEQEQQQRKQKSDPPGHSSRLPETPATSLRGTDSDLHDDSDEDMLQAVVDMVLDAVTNTLKINGEK
ncbi:ataxin-3-like protein isoform X1 [Aotus nancymaae]|uniref:ataxin-3-like protein isoform X1 n=1 Tax=Aotus nancymaae TaxID=37293 RepID=UPI000626BEFC|nr:ataxin-3-like protein [Aotus nancymaae]